MLNLMRRKAEKVDSKQQARIGQQFDENPVSEFVPQQQQQQQQTPHGSHQFSNPKRYNPNGNQYHLYPQYFDGQQNNNNNNNNSSNNNGFNGQALTYKQYLSNRAEQFEQQSILKYHQQQQQQQQQQLKQLQQTQNEQTLFPRKLHPYTTQAAATPTEVNQLQQFQRKTPIAQSQNNQQAPETKQSSIATVASSQPSNEVVVHLATSTQQQTPAKPQKTVQKGENSMNKEASDPQTPSTANSILNTTSSPLLENQTSSFNEKLKGEEQSNPTDSTKQTTEDKNNNPPLSNNPSTTSHSLNDQLEQESIDPSAPATAAATASTSATEGEQKTTPSNPAPPCEEGKKLTATEIEAMSKLLSIQADGIKMQQQYLFMKSIRNNGPYPSYFQQKNPIVYQPGMLPHKKLKTDNNNNIDLNQLNLAIPPYQEESAINEEGENEMTEQPLLLQQQQSQDIEEQYEQSQSQQQNSKPNYQSQRPYQQRQTDQQYPRNRSIVSLNFPPAVPMQGNACPASVTPNNKTFQANNGGTSQFQPFSNIQKPPFPNQANIPQSQQSRETGSQGILGSSQFASTNNNITPSGKFYTTNNNPTNNQQSNSNFEGNNNLQNFNNQPYQGERVPPPFSNFNRILGQQQQNHQINPFIQTNSNTLLGGAGKNTPPIGSNAPRMNSNNFPSNNRTPIGISGVRMNNNTTNAIQQEQPLQQSQQQQQQQQQPNQHHSQSLQQQQQQQQQHQLQLLQAQQQQEIVSKILPQTLIQIENEIQTRIESIKNEIGPLLACLNSDFLNQSVLNQISNLATSATALASQQQNSNNNVNNNISRNQMFNNVSNNFDGNSQIGNKNNEGNFNPSANHNNTNNSFINNRISLDVRNRQMQSYYESQQQQQQQDEQQQQSQYNQQQWEQPQSSHTPQYVRGVTPNRNFNATHLQNNLNNNIRNNTNNNKEHLNTHNNFSSINDNNSSSSNNTNNINNNSHNTTTTTTNNSNNNSNSLNSNNSISQVNESNNINKQQNSVGASHFHGLLNQNSRFGIFNQGNNAMNFSIPVRNTLPPNPNTQPVQNVSQTSNGQNSSITNNDVKNTSAENTTNHPNLPLSTSTISQNYNSKSNNTIGHETEEGKRKQETRVEWLCVICRSMNYPNREVCFRCGRLPQEGKTVSQNQNPNIQSNGAPHDQSNNRSGPVTATSALVNTSNLSNNNNYSQNSSQAPAFNQQARPRFGYGESTLSRGGRPHLSYKQLQEMGFDKQPTDGNMISKNSGSQVNYNNPSNEPTQKQDPPKNQIIFIDNSSAGPTPNNQNVPGAKAASAMGMKSATNLNGKAGIGSSTNTMLSKSVAAASALTVKREIMNNTQAAQTPNGNPHQKKRFYDPRPFMR